MQHGGPPSALMAGAIERFGDEAEAFMVTRLTFELLRAIPMVPLRVRVEPIRMGRRAQQLAAVLEDDTGVLARAVGLRLRRSPLELPPPKCSPRDPLPTPEHSTPLVFPFFRDAVGYHTAVEVRIARGQWAHGETAAWLRLRHPLVAGEPTSALQHVITVADAANGVCPALDPRHHAFINPDLTVYLRRELRYDGDAWVGLDARSIAEPEGIGLVEATIFDRDGDIGMSLQSLVVAKI
jgi:hypothetical protein